MSEMKIGVALGVRANKSNMFKVRRNEADVKDKAISL